MFQRKAYDQLVAWKARSQGRTALLLEGARRVGKTTLARAFARNEYADSLIIDFSQVSREVLEIFEHQRGDLDRLFAQLQAYFDVRLRPRRALVVFDEVQRFPPARELVKHLVADGRYDILETGSLVSIKKNVSGIVIPSEEEALELHPFDFEEYLWALGSEPLALAARDAFARLEPLPQAVHRKAERLFREYLLVGGMPQVIAAYAQAKDFGEADRVKRRILKLYQEDIAKFSNGDHTRLAALFAAIPGQLTKREKRFTLARLGASARYRQYAGALFWLESSRTVNVCRGVSDPAVGLALSEDAAAFKCYMADTGLLCAHAFADRGETPNALYRQVLLEKLSLNEGMLVENAVAQQLRAAGYSLHFYSRSSTDNRERMEIDFLIVRDVETTGMKARLNPIEVKSTDRYGLKSLDKFKAKFARRVGAQYVLHPRPLKVEGERVFLPLYMAHLL